jgi:hypothetical protein
LKIEGILKEKNGLLLITQFWMDKEDLGKEDLGEMFKKVFVDSFQPNRR